MTQFNVRHGGPYDRGSSDAYYGREYNPHYYRGKTYASECVNKSDMTEAEIAEYDAGYDEEYDRKDWR